VAGVDIVETGSSEYHTTEASNLVETQIAALAAEAFQFPWALSGHTFNATAVKM
jgi:hypothetical protein